MSSSGPNSPGTLSAASTGNPVGSNRAYVNPSNAGASDNVYATIGHNTGFNVGAYLLATNFGFSVSGTIDGIVVEVERKAQTNVGGSNYLVENSVKLIKGGTVSGTDKADNVTAISTTEAYKTFGSSSDLWGLTLLDTDVNASNFGVAYCTKGGAIPGKTANTESVDHIRMTVYYTAGGAAGQPTSKRFGGVPFMGAHGSGLQAPVRQWIRRASGLLTPQFATTQIWRPAHGID